MTLFVLFLIGAGFVAYVMLRKKTIPIAHVGLLIFLGSRTRWVFDEGIGVVPLGCRLELLEVKDHVAILPAEDLGCGDGFKIITKGAIVRYRLRQIISIGSDGRFRTSILSILHRVIPYSMDSRTAEYLSMEEAVHALVPKKAQQAMSTFCGTKAHSQVLGYHVIRFVDALIKAGENIDITPDDRVKETRRALQQFVIEELSAEFASTALDIVSFTIDDYDPIEKEKVHIDEAKQKIREIQVRRLQTSAEVDRALQIAEAAAKFAKEHPGAQLDSHYVAMRQLDNNQIGAENLSVIGQIFQAVLANLQQPSAPTVPPSPAPMATPVTV
ncbi:MAG: hypothetical protein Q8O51_02390 [bacterium]|nr:hypothetical protein [bacterium]